MQKEITNPNKIPNPNQNIEYVIAFISISFPPARNLDRKWSKQTIGKLTNIFIPQKVNTILGVIFSISVVITNFLYGLKSIFFRDSFMQQYVRMTTHNEKIGITDSFELVIKLIMNDKTKVTTAEAIPKNKPYKSWAKNTLEP